MDEPRAIFDSALCWRVPTAGDPRLLRLALAQVGLATIVAALVLLVAVPREWLGIALAGLIPLAIFMAFRRWHAYRRSFAGENNVWIDRQGVHWLDAAGARRSFPADQIMGFRIARDQDTLRPVPSLTLDLWGGFESQPIELHEPATPERVRQALRSLGNLPERDSTSDFQTAGYDLAVAVYSECHDDFQEWHWEGTEDELVRLFAQFAAAADELPLPPPGAKPAARTIVLNRRDQSRLRIAKTNSAHLEPGFIAASASLLHEIAKSAASALNRAAEPYDVSFNVAIAAHDTWTFHLHVLPS